MHLGLAKFRKLCVARNNTSTLQTSIMERYKRGGDEVGDDVSNSKAIHLAKRISISMCGEQ